MITLKDDFFYCTFMQGINVFKKVIVLMKCLHYIISLVVNHAFFLIKEGKWMTSAGTDKLALAEGSLIDIALEGWRFTRACARMANKLELEEASRYANQLRYFQKKLEESLGAAGLTLVNVEGHDRY
ncbi:hypothetical protein [Undibacterium terreum]|nr:hypothetical protein [Undibacterium terreum]